MTEVYESKTIVVWPMRYVMAAEGVAVISLLCMPEDWPYFLLVTAVLGLVYLYLSKLQKRFEKSPVFAFDENGFDCPKHPFSPDRFRYSWDDIQSVKIFFDHHHFHIQFKFFYELNNSDLAGVMAFSRRPDFTKADLKMICDLVAIAQKKVPRVNVSDGVKEKAVIY